MNGILTGFIDELTKVSSQKEKEAPLYEAIMRPGEHGRVSMKPAGAALGGTVGALLGDFASKRARLGSKSSIGTKLIRGSGIAGLLAGALLAPGGKKSKKRSVDLIPSNRAAREIAAKSKSHEKKAAAKTHLTPDSSNINGFSYDPRAKQLTVTFKGGSTYRYRGVPQATFRSLRRNKSAGKTLNRLVKARDYEYEKIAKKKKQKSYKCKFCKDQATKGVIWAEGRGIVPCCDKHLGKGKSSIDDPKDIDLIRDLTKQAGSKFTTFLRTAPEEKLLAALENVVGSARPTYYKSLDITKFMNYLRGGGDKFAPSISSMKRDELVKAVRQRLAAGFPKQRLRHTKDGDVEFGRSLKERAGSKMIRVSHGGSASELESIIKYGPNAAVPVVPGAAGKKEVVGLFVHKPSDVLAERLPGYAKRRVAYAGGKPAVLSFDIPERLISEGGRIGGGEHIVPASLWRYAKNTKITKVGGSLLEKTSSDAQRAFYASTSISPYYAKRQRDKRKQQEINRLLKKAGFLRERVREGNSSDLIGRMTKKRRQIEKIAGACVKTLTWGGLTMKFEYLKDDIRSGTGEGGKKWSRKMKDCYGYIPNTYGKGADGEAIDVYFQPDPTDGPVFKIRQLKKEGGYDEDKFMVGYGTSKAAKAAFDRNMPAWAFGDITSLSMKSFRTLVGQSGSKIRVPSDSNAERERVRRAMERKSA